MKCWMSALLSLLSTGLMATAEDRFAIRVTDAATGRGVPLVELETVNHSLYVTDSAGLIAFQEPGLMNREVYFHVRSHGYQFPADGFGNRGVKLNTVPGTQAEVKLERINVAERLYRVTGEGIYRDSILLGRAVPIQHPAVNSGVMGSDSVLTAVFRGKIHWFWGDTNLCDYPLGIFDTTGATSELPNRGGLPPSQGIDLTYFADENGRTAGVARMPGSGPTWLSGLTVLPDADNNERMFAGYAKIHPPLEVYERGIAEFDPQTNRFQRRNSFAADVPLSPDGHPLEVVVAGQKYIYFANPFPLVRVLAQVDTFSNLSAYEGYTCLKPGSGLSDPILDRGPEGDPIYDWKPGTPPLDWKTTAKLLEEGKLREHEPRFQLTDFETGKRVIPHSGSVAWNAWRQKYVMIALEVFGSSMLGEIWYSEADAPLGPWAPACKIVTHDDYSFYNPRHHPMLDEEGGRIIYFEGTYTQTFSGNTRPTPRYDYNQIMYRLDLADKRLPTATGRDQ